MRLCVTLTAVCLALLLNAPTSQAQCGPCASAMTAPSAFKLPVQSLQTPIRFPVHFDWLRRKAVVQRQVPAGIISFFQSLAYSPPPSGYRHSHILVLGLVLGSQTQSAPKPFRAIDDTAPPRALRTSEPMPAPAKRGRGRADRDELRSKPALVSLSVAETQACLFDGVGDRCLHRFLIRPSNVAAVSRYAGPRAAKPGEVDYTPKVFNLGRPI